MKPHTAHFLLSLVLVAFGITVVFWFLNTRRESMPPKVQKFVDKLYGAFKSKTVWFNALALVFLQQLPDFISYLAQNMSSLQPFIPAEYYQLVVGAIAVANIVLRFKTTHPLEAK